MNQESLTQEPPNHLQEVVAASSLVEALKAACYAPKPLIKSTDRRVYVHGSIERHIFSWKTSEIAYHKGNDLPTLARGLFTQPLTPKYGDNKHKIVVRGYDKFFNIGELPWTKPQSIQAYTTAPYVLTFKENGCIIFIAAISTYQVIVTSKHHFGSIPGIDVSHSEKGDQWLDIHLSKVGKTRQQLALELWSRNETAVFELCDDEFEEHVLEYSREKSGLYLHGLNANSAAFKTRPMSEVDAFSKEWGFIPTRWMEFGSLQQVEQLTEKIGMTGKWEGQPIEGFVIRTHMPSEEQVKTVATTSTTAAGQNTPPISPPYAPGQAWFYKVKFDEPYLMYRDWRELTRKMIAEKAAWEKKIEERTPYLLYREARQAREVEKQGVAAQESTQQQEVAAQESTSSPTDSDSQQAPVDSESKLSKNAQKKEIKRLEREKKREEARAHALAKADGIFPPDPPQSRSKRPETLLFVEWCFALLYGNESVKPRPELFSNFMNYKGIIRLRNEFLAYLDTAPGQKRFVALGGRVGGTQQVTPANQQEKDTRPFTHTVIAPIAVPGCGKTVLAVALEELFGLKHVMSDDFKNRKGFLQTVEREIGTHKVVFADKNNHLFQHRDELVELVQKLGDPNRPAPKMKKKGKSQKKGSHGGDQSEQVKEKEDEEEEEWKPPRIRTIALAWQLDTLSLNTLHRICSDRILARGDNHQTLRADRTGMAGTREHETILWRFLEQLQPFGSALAGNGSEGFGDAKFDHTLWLGVDGSLEENLRLLVTGLAPLLDLPTPSDEQIQRSIQTALAFRATVRRETKDEKKETAATNSKVRYYGVAVEMSICSAVSSILDGLQQTQVENGDVVEKAKTMMKDLLANDRVISRPHITLVHSVMLENDQDARQRWQVYALLAAKGDPVQFQIHLNALVFNDRVMAFSIDNVETADIENLNQVQGESWKPHVTIGTSNQTIRPFEAGQAICDAEAGKLNNYRIPISQGGIQVMGRLQAMNH